MWVNLDRIGQWSCFLLYSSLPIEFRVFQVDSSNTDPRSGGKTYRETPIFEGTMVSCRTHRSSESLSEPAGTLVNGEERDHDSKLSLVPYDPRVENQSRANLIWRYYSFRMN